MNDIGTNSPYFSFLICQHPKAVNLYVNGLPIGNIEQGKFVPAKLGADKDNQVPISINNLADPFPFSSTADLKSALIAIVNSIEINEPTKKP